MKLAAPPSISTRAPAVAGRYLDPHATRCKEVVAAAEQLECESTSARQADHDPIAVDVITTPHDHDDSETTQAPRAYPHVQSYRVPMCTPDESPDESSIAVVPGLVLT